MPNRLSIGISEDRGFQWPPIPSENFSDGGRYRTAIDLVNRLLNKSSTEAIHLQHWQQCVNSGSTLPAASYEEAREKFRAEVPWILILESETARIWKEGPKDYVTMLREYSGKASADAKKLRSALAELKHLDSKHAYLLRHTLQRAMQDFLSEKKKKRVKRPNMNLEKGYDWLTVSGPEVRESEFQFLSKLSFFQFDKFIESWEREVDVVFKPWKMHWMEFGALRFEKEVSPKAAAKLNVVQLGLIARLVSRIRDFTAGYGIRIYSTGQPIPEHGKPCWEIVAEFVNCALDPTNPLTGESARRSWQSLSKKHRITTQSWPRPGKSEQQAYIE